jgi:hypothetical protein
LCGDVLYVRRLQICITTLKTYLVVLNETEKAGAASCCGSGSLKIVAAQTLQDCFTVIVITVQHHKTELILQQIK